MTGFCEIHRYTACALIKRVQCFFVKCFTKRLKCNFQHTNSPTLLQIPALHPHFTRFSSLYRSFPPHPSPPFILHLFCVNRTKNCATLLLLLKARNLTVTLGESFKAKGYKSRLVVMFVSAPLAYEGGEREGKSIKLKCT